MSTHDCYAGFGDALAAIGNANEKHADRDGLTGVERAVFLARGGHAPGAVCPTAEPIEQHHSGCAWFMGEDCDFGCPKQASPSVPSGTVLAVDVPLRQRAVRAGLPQSQTPVRA